ncbi:MAG: acyl-ACP--UDP-N-acetylglucosamine O-acyltransferase [Phycisphaerales bacterium]
MPNVHPTAIVDPASQLADDVEIGPFCCITGPVKLSEGVRLLSHVTITGNSSIGANTIVYPNAAIGFEPQDYKFKPGMLTAGVSIGENCLIREHATVHAASKEHRPTTIGDRVFLMVNAHVGHDATVHNDVILVNNVALAGHCEVFDKAIMSGGSMLHQFGRVGRMAMCSGGSVLTNDVPPYCITAQRNMLVGINLIGMRRSGMPRSEIDAVKSAYREVFSKNPGRKEMLDMLDERGQNSPAVAEMATFVRGSKRSLTPVGGRRYRNAKRPADQGEE